MANFKSDSVDAVSTNSYIPTGAIVTIAGPYSEYSDTSYTALGLIPCDGRTLNGSASPQYSTLFSVIGTLYGGTGIASFKVPDLTTNKLTIVGTSSSFYNTNTVGTKLTSGSHSHSTSMTNNSFSMNDANVTHSHNYNFDNISNMDVDNAHSHNAVGVVSSMGGANKNGPAGTAGGALIGNHVHNFGNNVNANWASTGAGAHSHGGSVNANSGNAGDAAHSHASSLTSSVTSNNNNLANTTGVPYSNMLYFIRI